MKLQNKNSETPECGTTSGGGRKIKLKLNSGLCPNVVRKPRGHVFNEWLMKRWMFTETTGATASLRQDEPTLKRRVERLTQSAKTNRLHHAC